MSGSRSILAALILSIPSALAAPCALGQEAIRVDPDLRPYERVSGIAGDLNSIGSDTLNNLMTLWGERFHEVYPGVNFQIEGKGSSTAPPALAAGSAQLGPMSRRMKAQEIEAFERARGYEPTRVGVALDSLAVYVHKDNPVRALSLEDLDGVFSRTRRSGAPDIRTWAQLGVEGPLARRPISLYGRNSASGTYGYFKEHALFKGDYRDTVKEQPGSASVVMGVTHDPAGIGYSGIGYRTSGVRAIALAARKRGKTYEPSYENVLAGKYPLGRMLYVYVDKAPNRPLPAPVEEFLRFVLSLEGQKIVVKGGYLPLPAAAARKQLETFHMEG